MKAAGIIMAILVLAIMLVPGVSAQDGNYTVTPGKAGLQPVIVPLTVGTIVQGETDWYSIYVPSGTTSITADLNWGNPSNSLSLAAIAPDGTIGPLYDSADGAVDGRIFVTISRAGGLASGTWNFRVYGASVSGVQSYNFVAY
jgi:hypothetical protein